MLTPRSGAYYRDPELHYPEERVVRTRSLELSRTGKRLLRTDGDDVRAAEVGGARAALRTAARSVLYHPDPQIGWYPTARRAARSVLRHDPPEAILSSSFPITAHLVARRLHRESGAPWVADFRDPWSVALPAGLARRRARRLERALTREASAVTMTSPSWAKHHAVLWERPVEVIPNGHDPVASEAAKPPAERVVSYLGTYYPETQDLSAALTAVRRLADSEGPTMHRLRFIGTLHPVLRERLDALGLSPLVEETGFVSHRVALVHLRRSSAILIAGPKDARGVLQGHVAGKIPECLATGLPIVYKLVSRRRAGETLLGGYWDYAGERDVDWVSGAFMLVPRRVFEVTGGFDERLFMYGEDMEWCQRIQASDWRVRYYANASVKHFDHSSSNLRWGDERVTICLHRQLGLYREQNGAARAAVLLSLRIVASVLRTTYYPFRILGPRGDSYLPMRRYTMHALRVLGTLAVSRGRPCTPC